MNQMLSRDIPCNCIPIRGNAFRYACLFVFLFEFAVWTFLIVCTSDVCLGRCFTSVNFSVIKYFFLSSTKQRFKCIAQRHNTVSVPQVSLGLETLQSQI